MHDPLILILPTVILPWIFTLFKTSKSAPIKTFPEIEAPPKVVKLPPDPIPVEFDTFAIFTGQVVLNRFDSNDNSFIDTIGFVPSPIINLLGVKLDLPVPPYGTLIVFADHVPVLIFPIAVTCVKLLFTLIILPFIVIPLPACIPADEMF